MKVGANVVFVKSNYSKPDLLHLIYPRNKGNVGTVVIMGKNHASVEWWEGDYRYQNTLPLRDWKLIGEIK